MKDAETPILALGCALLVSALFHMTSYVRRKKLEESLLKQRLAFGKMRGAADMYRKVAEDLEQENAAFRKAYKPKVTTYPLPNRRQRRS